MDADIGALLTAYRLPAELGFGRELAPVMYRADYVEGEWLPGSLVPFGPVPLNPAATAVQFAQQAFEGMKAYWGEQSAPALFRPEMNCRRFARSAARLVMPAVPAGLFADALHTLVEGLREFIPRKPGQSLYLRPTLLGTGPTFAVKGSDTFTFLLLASPSDAYYPAPMSALVERGACRVARGGTGAEKVGGNYAASLQATEACIARGFDQPLWLDPEERRFIEEFSGMNFMAVIDDSLHTPALSGSILPGVTRDAIITLAPRLGHAVHQRRIPVDELLDAIRTEQCTEVFACSTAAVVCPVKRIGDTSGETLTLSRVGDIANQVRSALLDIQEGRAEDVHRWMQPTGDLQALVARLSA